MTVVISLSLLAVSCRPTRYVPAGSYLLTKTKITSDDTRISRKHLKDIPRQQSNQKILGFMRFHLWVHNMCMTGKKNKTKKWILETVSEPPTIYDSQQAEKTREYLTQYMKGKGYLDAKVTMIELKNNKKNKIKLQYKIKSGKPYRVDSVIQNIPFAGYKDVLAGNDNNSFIEKGAIFDIDNLTAEKSRIGSEMRNNGYFYFDDESVTFIADTVQDRHSISLTMNISPPLDDSVMVAKAHKKYKIHTTWIVANYSSSEFLKNKQGYFTSLDTTILRDSMYLLCKGKPHVNPSIFLNNYLIKNGEYFNSYDVEKTKNYISQNKIFRQVTIEFKEKTSTSADGALDCYILVSPNVKQSYSVELEGTNTGGDLGAQVSVMYENKNLFRSAEVFNVKFRNSYEQNSVLSKEDNLKNFNSREIGVDAGIEFPKFLFPFCNPSFSKNYRLRSFVKAGYSFQKIPYYARSLQYLSFGYISRGQKYVTQYFTPFEINSIQYRNKSDAFKKFINKRYYYMYSYEDYYISSSSYTLVYNTKSPSLTHDYMLFIYSSEISGNFLNLFSTITGRPSPNGYFQILNTRFAQYVKNDIDLRYYFVQSPATMQVFRINLGIANPFGNSDVMPNIKKYYAGGSNSMRAWGIRSLGPGSYSPAGTADSSNVRYAMGDIKLEMNAEQRFPIFGFINGALFLDAGNIWTTRNIEQGSNISSRWYDDIAIATGVGIRLDFSFFIFRLDAGLKTRDPSLPMSYRWLWNRHINLKKDMNYSIGIGYPF